MDNTHIEKSPKDSKKFLAFLTAHTTISLLMAGMIYMSRSDILMIASLILCLFLDVGYIVGQAALDKYVRTAAIAAGLINPASKSTTEDS